MRAVRIDPRHLDRILEAARSAYPDEACGFLFSEAVHAEGPDRTVSGVEAAANEFDGERRRRFVITPTELRSAELRGQGRGEVVSGFYHSHPDHPPRPSHFDAEHAWPWYTYVVVSVHGGDPRGVGAFELDPGSSRFVPCELRIGAGSPSLLSPDDPRAAET